MKPSQCSAFIAAVDGLMCVLSGWHFTTATGHWMDVLMLAVFAKSALYFAVTAMCEQSDEQRPVWVVLPGDQEGPLAFPTEFAECMSVIYQRKEPTP